MPRSSFKLVLLLALGAAVTAAAPRASAQSAADLATAGDLVVEGRAARDRGDFASAREKFAAAHALIHSPVTGLDLAKALQSLGRLAEAREIALSVERLPKNPRETAASLQARKEASALADSLYAALGTVRLGLPASVEGLHVTVDGAEVPPEALSVARRVDPGAHAIDAWYEGGAHAPQTVTVPPGEAVTVPLAPARPATPPPVSATTPPPVFATPPPPSPPPAQGSSARTPLLVTGAAVAGAGLVVGVGAGLAARSALSPCDAVARTCPTQDPLDRARPLATVSTIGFAAVGVGAALAVVGLALPGPRAVGLRVAPTVGGLSISGAFR